MEPFRRYDQHIHATCQPVNPNKGSHSAQDDATSVRGFITLSHRTSVPYVCM